MLLQLTRRPRARRLGIAALGAGTAVALLLSGCAYHEGDQTARDWNSWVKQHPLKGARVTDVVGTNVQPFVGSFEAYARLTAPPSETSIKAAMASMCRFDKVTRTPTAYFLQIDRILVQAPCSASGQVKYAAFWTTTSALEGVEQLTFTSKGVDLTASDAALTSLVPEVSAAAEASGMASRTTNLYASPHVHIEQKAGSALTDELGLTQGVLDSVGGKVLAIEVVGGRVSAATSGSVSDAQGWQDSVGHGSPILTVTPAHLRTEKPLTAPERGLLERMSTDPDVTDVAVTPSAWTIDTPSTKDGRALVAALNSEGATSALGRLTLDVATTGVRKDRPCLVQPRFPDHSRAEALFDLCDRPDVANVDDRASTMDLRITSDDLAGVLELVHRLPAKTDIYLELKDNTTIDMTTGSTLTTQFPQSDLGKQLTKIWDGLGPLRG
ncbi:MAG TPA: hypothetical protein VHZ06_10125 [Marmoricola sp.]|jgi:hypothetical protein|nr:hypothetical protein [Marmoricola sp.]